MSDILNIVDKLMVDVFNDIGKIEENALRTGIFDDLSVTEMHTIAAIGVHSKVQMSDIAKKLNITVGTLTVAINNLVKKDYVERCSSEGDRRVVLVRLKKKGRVVFRMHEKFHLDMMKEAISVLTEGEQKVMGDALGKLHTFLSNASLQK